MKQLGRKDLSSIFGGASCSANCLNGTTGHEYVITCSGGSSCSSSDYNGCSSGDDVKSCGNVLGGGIQ